MLAVTLTPVAVLAGALGVWRFGADPGWTNRFFIADGLLSHWQAWFAVAICVYASGRGLNRWHVRFAQFASEKEHLEQQEWESLSE